MKYLAFLSYLELYSKIMVIILKKLYNIFGKNYSVGCVLTSFIMISKVAFSKFSLFRSYRIYMTYFTVCILVFMSGSSIGWVSPIIKKLNNTDDNPVGRPLTVDESSWVASISTMGIIVGSLICGVLGKFIGRKPLLTIMGVPHAIFCLIMAFTKEPWLFIIARLFSGITSSAVLGVCPMYFSELAKPEQRGKLFIIISISTNLGSLYALSAGPFVSFFAFHISLLIFPILFLIFFPIFAYESPYIVIRRDPVKGEELLKKIRNKIDVSEEMERIREGFIEDKGLNLMEMFKLKAARRALFITLTLGVCVMLSGNTTVLTYTQFIFEKAGGVWSPEVNTIVLSTFQLFITLASSPFGDKFGRRVILSSAFTVAALSEIVLGIYLVLVENEVEMGSIIKWLPLISLMIFVAASSLISIAPSLAGEFFSPEAKDVSTAIGILFGGLSGFAITFLFQRVQNSIGLGETFLIFAGICLVAAAFIIVFVIETRGKTLEEIQNELSNNRITAFK